MLAGKPNLVLTTAWGYRWAELEPFVSSLRRTGYSGEIVFFVRSLSAGTRKKLAQAGVRCIDFDLTAPYLDAYPFDLPRVTEKPLPLLTLRFFLYQSFLRSQGDRYAHVLLADVRDVLFQKDPFAGAADGLSCFSERDDISIAESPTNLRWVEEAFGHDAGTRIGARPILCAGTIMGTVPALLDLLAVFERVVFAQDRPEKVNDQGAYNYLIHENLAPHTIYRNDTGRVLTLALENTIRMDESGNVYDAAGHIPAVIHQYDRHPLITRRHYRRPLKLLLLARKFKPRRLARITRYRLARVTKGALSPAAYAKLKAALKHP